ncbi:hypothetical protein GCM10008960_41890 [Deinococcus sedimenti]|uniref:Uncharacterized protein n=1 Tax=Deinococcus sedimenti TaxID=1867090 RepID=A0ABQ2S9U9_9DEIO|nr:hypothetical protein DEGR_38670 [Deinococcus grandis]GGS11617.1 hypothetical protein GCM10008960_41890 [Deinococcus sedimenti]
MFRPVPRQPGKVAATVLHHQLITVEWSADGPQYVRPPWTGMVETLYMRLQATQERLPFRVRTTAQARTAAEVVGVREASLLGARAALHSWLTAPPPHVAPLIVDHTAVPHLIRQTDDEDARGLLRRLLQALARIDQQLSLTPVGAALGTGLPFEQCRILLFQMERDGQLHVYADHYRLKVLPAPTPVAALRDLPAPAFHALTRNPQLADLLEDRWNEAELLARTPAHRMALIAYGAVLEGALLAAVQDDPRVANIQVATPKERDSGKPKPFHDWTLTDLIQVAEQAGWLHRARGKLGHVVRDFRNYVHPREELRQQTSIDLGVVHVSREGVWFCVDDLVRARPQ